MSPTHAPSENDNILIVDDTPANLRLLSQLLTSRGYRVRAVTSGQRALESVAAQLPTLILLDIRMKGLSGFEVCARLKEDPRTADIPIIFISALTEVEDKVAAFQLGGVDYITKPFHVAEVLARIETHLSLRTLQARLQNANEKVARELALAGKVQCSFLPHPLPQPPGWRLAAALRPARETSGDFYDVFRLPNGSLALVIADVVDKGVAAALFMALSWSLLRTYAAIHPDRPDQVFAAVNERLVQDAHAGQFVTVFYGVLDPGTGGLCYANAGQNPPLLLGEDHEHILTNTGPPLGILERCLWECRNVTIPPGGALTLYTDGITEAEKEMGNFFGAERLRAAVAARRQSPAPAILDGLLADVAAFTGAGPQLDDIALVIATRLA